MTHIAREGEQEFASIHRNRSGFDAGCIDYGVRVQAIENLSTAERAELLATARAMLASIERCCSE